MTSQEFGQLGELHVMRILSEAGILTHWGGVSDLLAGGVPVEVKAARQTEYSKGKRGYRFCLCSPGRKGFQGDVLVLLCYWNMNQPPGVFVIPAHDVGRRRSITIPGQPWTYGGKWSGFYDDWGALADAIGQQQEGVL